MKLRTQSLAVILVGLSILQSLGAWAGESLILRSGRVVVAPQDSSIAPFPGDSSQTSQLPSVFVAQWSGRLDESLRVSLTAKGFEVLRYLPEDAWVLTGPARLNAVDGSELGARALMPLSPEWKISPELMEASVSQASKQWLLVSAFKPEWISLVLRELRSIPGVAVLRFEGSEIAISAPLSQLEAIASIDQVEWIQELPVFVSLDYSMASDLAPLPRIAPEFTGYESGTKIMGFDAAWSRGFTGRGQKAALADTGVDTGDLATLHGDLKSVVAKGYALGLGGKSWGDPQGHGTHVCGSVVGTGALSGGNLKGGAYEATMLPASIWSPIMDNLAFPSDFNKLFDPPYADGARIHTNSWGSPRNLGEYDTFATNVDKYVWDHPDLLVIFAAGNSGEDANADGRIDEGSIGSPATSKNVLSVGASENLLAVGGIQKPIGQLRDGDKKWGAEPIKSDFLSNNPDGIAAFSSRGPTKDGRIKPEIVAPGTNIVSTRSHHPKATTLWGVFDDEYVYAGGTSMATPLTAGAAVVARQYLVEAAQIASPSAALLKGTLVHSAHDLFPGQYGRGQGQELLKPRPNVHEGYGRVDVDAMTQLVGRTVFVDEKTGVGTGESKEVSFSLGAGKGIRATLVYTDAPASPSAGKTLVNNLDLEVVDSSGAVTRLQDAVNNLEMVEIQPGLARGGDYIIRVVGKSVPQGKVGGKLPYALLISAVD